MDNLCLNVVQRKLALTDLKCETIPKAHTLLNDNLIKKRMISLENEIVSQKCLLTSKKKKLEQEESKLVSHERYVHFLERKRIDLQKSLKSDINKVSP